LMAFTGARADNRTQRRAYESLRRIAKFKGVDVHIAGDRSLQAVADHVVDSATDLQIETSNSGIGQSIAELLRSEKMTHFQRAEMDIPTPEEAMKAGGLTHAEALSRIAWMKSQTVWINNLYQVNVEYLPDSRAHLIIRRLDRQPVHNWQHFQQIKNEILGPECEAIEIYPPESKLVDAKHHYHLWGFRAPGRTLGIGFKDRQVTDPD